MTLGLIEQVLENQKQIQREFRDIALDYRLKQEWYLDSDCARLKGISKSWLSENKWAQPRGGEGKEFVAGRWRHHRTAVKEWLGQSDVELWKLHGDGTTATPPLPVRAAS